ncbi:MAG TPA: hypothetical protein VH437_16530 [Terriglobales bacterium]
MAIGRRRGCLANLLGVLVLCVAVVYVVAGITSPWAFHIGGRLTPLLYWQGRGKLVTKNGVYPLYVYFFLIRISHGFNSTGCGPPEACRARAGSVRLAERFST